MSTVELQASAASELYRAELALSDARDSGVAAWITAASNRLLSRSGRRLRIAGGGPELRALKRAVSPV